MSQSAATLSPEEIAWILDGAKAVQAIDDALDVDAMKRNLLTEARIRLDAAVGDIKVGEDFKVDTLDGFLKQKVTLASIGEDPNEEIDTGHDTAKMTGMDGKDFALLMNAHSIVAKETETLRLTKHPTENRPLFSDKEIAEAIWAPLMRRKLIGENAIPSRYSEVAKTFSGASAAYETRLAAFTDDLSKFDKAIQRLGVAKDVIDGTAALATGVMGDLGALGIDKDPYEVLTMIKGIQLACDSATVIPAAILKENGRFNWTSMESICKDLQKTVPGLINAGFSAESWNEVNLGKCIAYAVGGAFSAPLIVKKLKDGKYAEILDDLGSMTTAAMNAYTYDVKAEGEKDEGPGGQGKIQFNEFGMMVGGIISTAGAALVEKLKGETVDRVTILKIMEGAAQKTIDAASMVRFDEEKADLEAQAASNDGTDKATDNAQKLPHSPDLALAYGVIEPEWQAMRDAAAGAAGWGTPDKIMKAIQAKGLAALQKLNKDDPLYKKMEGLAKLVDKQQKEIADAGLATLDEELAEDSQSFRGLLSRAESGGLEAEVEKIEQLVLQLKKDQMITNLLLSLAPLPAQAIAAFLPQANIAVAAIELMKNGRKALEHYRAYDEWQQNTRDARSAMSVQAEAMVNRMNISRNQGLDEVISGVENAIKIVGGAVGCAGPFAPAGHAIAASTAAFSTVRQLCTKYYRGHELDEAWKTYKKALDDPEDRKRVRAAIRTNPTLAKYVIAWGAEVGGSAVAKAAVQGCGLTEKVLSSEGANVSKVVTFLEALYPDDPVLLRPVDRPEDWYPGKVMFSSASLAAFTGAAETRAKPALAKASSSVLLTSLSRMETQAKSYAAAVTAWQAAAAATAALPPADPALPKARQDQADALQAVVNAANAALDASKLLLTDIKMFKPVDTAGKPHDGFAAYLKMLLPTARQFVDKFKHEAEAWAAQLPKDA